MNIHESTGAQLVVERVPNFNPQTTQLVQERGTGPPLLHVPLLLLKHSLSPHLYFQLLSASLLLPFSKQPPSQVICPLHINLSVVNNS